MTTLEKIRSNAALLITVIAVALFAFIIGDGLRSGSTFFQQKKEVALNIDGETVSIHDYQVRLKEMEQLAEQSGQKLNDQQRMMINNQLTQEYITTEALRKISEGIGLKVRPSELYALINGEGLSTSPLAQQFFAQFGINAADPEAVNGFIRQISEDNIKSLPTQQQSYLREIQSQWTALQRSIKANRLQEKLGSLLSRTFAINKVDLELEQGNSTRSVALVRTSTAMISDSTVNITDEELKKYYNDHKEFFAMKFPATEVDYINLKVVPSPADYKTAAEEKDKVIQDLTQEGDEENAIRNFNDKFLAKSFYTLAELEQMGFGTDNIDFIKTAAVGSVNAPELINDKYSIFKLIAKKTSPADLNVRMIALDSAGVSKVDSLQKALEQGADFAEMAKQYSIDPQTKDNGGLISYTNNYGMVQKEISEAAAYQMGVGELFEKPVGNIVRITPQGQNNGVLLLKAEAPGASVEKYKFVYAGIPVNFSDKTYNEKYTQINNILIQGGTFEDMAKKAEAAGIDVVRKTMVYTQTPQLGNIPESREIISWALKAEAGEVGEKLFRAGVDNLVIAAVNKHIPAGYVPMDVVKDQIKDRIQVEKRGEMLVKNLENKKLSSLEAYAENLSSKIDTLVGVNYQVRGSEAPEFNGYAMTTVVGKLSAPFSAGTEVMVVKPLSEEKPASIETVNSALTLQRRADLSRQMSYRAFNYILQNIKVEDNRARFY